MNSAAAKAFCLIGDKMPRDISLIAILQKLYAGETALHVACDDDGWTIELGDATHNAYASRKFTPDDIADLPKWIETESAKPRVAPFLEQYKWPRVAHLRVVK
jgi:hypothetical protein